MQVSIPLHLCCRPLVVDCLLSLDGTQIKMITQSTVTPPNPNIYCSCLEIWCWFIFQNFLVVLLNFLKLFSGLKKASETCIFLDFYWNVIIDLRKNKQLSWSSSNVQSSLSINRLFCLKMSENFQNRCWEQSNWRGLTVVPQECDVEIITYGDQP